jgi:hypothetical protein
MGYAKINNLYKDQRILLFRECWAMEKVHGTSAHVRYRKSDDNLMFFSGGASHTEFEALFDKEALRAKFLELGHEDVTVFGEAYGGKMQGMKDTYGPKLMFIAFDVKIGDNFLSVPDMDGVATALGFEVVPYEKVSTDTEAVNTVRDKPSRVAERRGCGTDKTSEGVVLRPLIECRFNDGERICAKHKTAGFEERRKTPKVSVDKLEVLAEANAVADEWVTEMRLTHVLDKLQPDGKVLELRDIPTVTSAMVADVYAEAAGEIVESKDVERAIKQKTAGMFKARVMEVKRVNN